MRTDTPQPIFLKDYRPPAYLIDRVDLSVRLDPTESEIRAVLDIRPNGDPAAPSGPLVLDGEDLKLVSIALDGITLTEKAYILGNDTLTLNAVPKGPFTLEIVNTVNPTANTRLMGLYRTSGTYCTQCEAEGFRRITYFLDRPDVLAVYTVRLEAAKAEAPVLLANGNPMDSGDIPGTDRHYAVWHDPYPKPSYLFAMVGGDLARVSDRFATASGRAVDLNIFVEHGKADSCAYAMDALKRSMKWDEDAFGREYDLDVFNIVAVSDFNMGAMENKGLNIFNDKYVLALEETATDVDYAHIESIIAHEYFHNWTGNRITCRDWFQLCLKEGLTVFRDQEFSADMRSAAVKRIQDVRTLRAQQFPEDAGPLSHPVRPEKYLEINNFYTATVYEKGAEIIRMLRTLIGADAFKRGMDLYFARHDGEAATVDEFLACFAEVSDLDVDTFSRWYAQAGTPEVTLATTYDADARLLKIDLGQTTPATPGQDVKKPVPIPIRLGLVAPDGTDLPLVTNEKLIDGDTVLLDGPEKSFTFSNVEARPVVSPFRGFSAPVRIVHDVSPDDRRHLAMHDSDPFNRWQAFQEFAMRLLVAAARSSKAASTKWDDKFIEAALAVAEDETLEPAFRAAMLTLPGEGEIAQTLGRNVDPHSIHEARMGLMIALGKALEPVRLSLKDKLATSGPYRPDAEDAGKRALKNAMLTLGVAAGGRQARADCLKAFETADNMNDRFAAFQRIVHLHGRQAAKNAIEAFEKEYGGDPLTMDKWFSAIASAPGSQAVSTVKKLMKHKAFTLSNPNRARSVLGAFAMGNPTGFNDISGEGYRLVAQKIGEIDAINPQIAARLLTAFRSLKMLEPKRRALAIAALEALRTDRKLSRDCSEIVDRILQ